MSSVKDFLKKIKKISWKLLPMDAFFFLIFTYTATYRWGFYTPGKNRLACLFTVLGFFVFTTLIRILSGVYSQVWRYGGIQSYIHILISDAIVYFASLTFYLICKFTSLISLPSGFSVIFITAICGINCLLCLSPRMVYRYAYKCGDRQDFTGKFLRLLLKIFADHGIYEQISEEYKRSVGSEHTHIAILGAGDTGTSLAQELISNTKTGYIPVCFIETDKTKTDREIFSLPVFNPETAKPDFLKLKKVECIVFAVPQLDHETLITLRDYYIENGFSVKVYDYPTLEKASKDSRRSIREFDISDLLFRKQRTITDDNTAAYYRGKAVLVTGGGGSIGSELCRQLAKMDVKQLIVLDVYENGAYDLQQELKISNPGCAVALEIISVCNREALFRVFDKYRPDVVIHAAAHKHVPLMEHNCCEAVENNIFGTLNTVDAVEKYACSRFIMVSTDKAVNPTNVMGATKRFCEMIVMNRAAKSGKTVFSATRFGNVLGSAGSVIPLFRRQIAAGGPLTVTDKRIIRYFMTIPEASQLVLESGPMADKGQLFVLDMGKPVKIFDLAVNMIKLSGLRPYEDIDIVETGLRPGEKLYEELLIKSETLEKTPNNLIFIEKDPPVADETLLARLESLKAAIKVGDNEHMKSILAEAVPTFTSPEAVNSKAGASKEMQEADSRKAIVN